MIREATEEDFEIILDMSEEFWKSTLFNSELDRDHTIKMVEMSFDMGLLAVAEYDGKVVGFCSAISSPSMGDPNIKVGTELAWWINPEHRKGRRGIELMFFMERLAEEQGVEVWSMASMESSNPEAANKIYERFGYKKSETMFTKILGSRG